MWDPQKKYPVGDVYKLGGLRSTIRSVIFIISLGRGRPKGVKDNRPRTVDTTQKSKYNKGDNGGTAATNGERSTTVLTFNEQREHGMLSRAALHQENVIRNEQLNHQ